MTTETRQRIRAYKRMLPDLRERVIAVALLLAMSASMLGSASFAWITLSRAPEVSGMSTTVAANGNLEIALAQGSISDPLDPPEESAVGDSSAAQGIVNANVTWGNLVNLSDPDYGVSAIALRPASLSSSAPDRIVTPLFGANYGNDGRVKNVLAEYQYASYKRDANGDGYFDARSIDYGVRAITSIKFDNVSTNAALKGYWEKINGEKGHYQKAIETYSRIIDNETDVGGGKKSMDALADIISLYAQDQINAVLGTAENDDYSKVITYFYRLMLEFQKILTDEGEMLRHIANMQIFLGDNTKGSEYYPTLDDFLKATNSELAALNVNLVSFKTLKSNYNDIAKYVDPDGSESIYQLAMDYDQNDSNKAPKTEKVPFSAIQSAVYKIVDINNTYLDDKYKVSTLGNYGKMELLGLLTSGDQHRVEIRAGIIKDTEERLGVTAKEKNVKMTVSTSLVTIEDALVYTAAAPNENGFFMLAQDIDNAEELDGGVTQGTDPVSKDTYGMAFDLWFRTNAEDAVLTLEGHTVTTKVQVKIEDEDGNEYDLYSITIDDLPYQAYKKEDGNWYYASSHQPIDSSLTVQKAEPVEEERVTGYEGENRVWEDMVHDGHIAQDSTTQGAGSCFVFYANPSEQKSIMNMLDAFRIFFMDSKGMELARARLITRDAYAISGKVTVPIEITSGTKYTEIGEDSAERTYMGITTLERNGPKFITAIMYLEGSELQNQDVLSAGAIDGQLNLQFGTSAELASIDDTELREQYRTITAEATYNGETSTDESTAIVGGQGSDGLPYDGNPKTIHVSLTVDGDQPKEISGFFVRTINATQGTKEETKTFTMGADGKWTADFDLSKPGKYMLRSVIVDGIEYPLMRIGLVDGLEEPLPAYPTVVIKGLNISNVRISNDQGDITSGEYMTADDRWPVTVSARIDATDSLMPKNVRAVFMGDQQEFNAVLAYDADNDLWTGSTGITQSGTYTLSYLVLDNEYMPISGPTVTLKLGMKAKITAYPREATKQIIQDGKEVWVNAGLETTSFEFKNGEKILMPIGVVLLNDLDQEMQLNADLKLYYHDGTGIDAYGLQAELKKEGNEYRGVFLLDEPGSYTFNRVEVQLAGNAGYSEIRKASRPPRIAPTSPYPPEYLSNSDVTEDIQIVAEQNGEASINVILPYASSLVQATMEVTQGDKKYTYPGVVGSVYGTPVTVTTSTGDTVSANTYKFDIPTTTQTGTRDGNWKIKTLHFWGVYANGQSYPAPEDGETWDVAQSYSFDVPQAETTRVIATLIPKLTRDGTNYVGENLGFPAGWREGNAFDLKDATADFMEPKKIAPVTVQIVDWFGEPVPDVEKVQWILRYAGRDGTATQTSQTYGGYTTSDGNQDDIIPQLNSLNSDGLFATQEDFTVAAAGKFTSVFKVDFVDTENQQANEVPEWRDTRLNSDIVVLSASKKPYVKFTATDPAAGTEFNGINAAEDNNVTRKNVISEDGYSVTCYYQGEITDNGCSQACSGYTASKATTTVYDLGSTFTSATCTIISKGDGGNIVFTYTPSELSDTQDIGSTSGSGSSAKRLGIGTNAEATQLIVIATDNREYTFTLTNKLYATATE